MTAFFMAKTLGLALFTLVLYYLWPMDNLKIGILGGGQLGMMLLRHAQDFGLQIAVLDKDDSVPAARYTNDMHSGDALKYEDVLAFGKDLDILTIEKEAVNTDALATLEQNGVKVYPQSRIIRMIQDKWLQKEFLQQHGIPVVPGISIAGRDDLRNHIDKLPGCLKIRRDGYDGNGVMMIRQEADIAAAFDAPSMLEEIAPIQSEIAVIVARNEVGQTKCYDPVMMVFDPERFVLDFQQAPANISQDMAAEAAAIAMKIAEKLDLVGIIAVEMFITKEGTLLVNELAPRPHNSGHHTIEACQTSQYEQLLRAITGLPLGDTTLTQPSVMVNFLWPFSEPKSGLRASLEAILAIPNAHLHWYGKKEHKPGRKMGHITITDTNMAAAQTKAEQIHKILKEL